MVTGHGPIDYIVVTAVACFTLYLLLTHPHRLLWFLPSFLTIDFFIPLGTNLTPSRLVPLLIAAWMLAKGEFAVPRPYRGWVELLLAAIAASTLAAFLIGDSGARPVIRALAFFNLVVLFVFSVRMMLRIRSVEPAMWGVAYAGLLHGGYSVYQLIANELGLPFRGIVYTANQAQAAVANLGAGLRINGLADEPKRMGYILFAGALAYAVFAMDSRYRERHGRRYFLLAVGLVGLSALTYSASYFGAVVIWAVFFLGFSRYLPGVLGVALAGLMVIMMVSSDFVETYTESLDSMFDQRLQEVVSDFDDRFITLRQEVYAQDYILDNPDVLLTGVGMGRSNLELYETYGPGVGYSAGKRFIVPLNSQLFEVIFNLGLVGPLVLYGALAALALMPGWGSFESWGISAILGFLVIQTVYVDDMYFMSFFAAVTAAYVRMRAEMRVWARQANPGGVAGGKS